MEHEAGAVRARGDYGMISVNQRSKAELFQRPTMREENCMYVPPFDSLLRAVGMTQAEFERSTRSHRYRANFLSYCCKWP